MFISRLKSMLQCNLYVIQFDCLIYYFKEMMEVMREQPRCYRCNHILKAREHRLCQECRRRQNFGQIQKILIDEISAQIKNIYSQTSSSQFQSESSQKRKMMEQRPEQNQQKQNLIQKKENHREEQASGKDIRQLDIDSYVVEDIETRKGLQISYGINIGGVCENNSCQAYNSLVYWGLAMKQSWNIPRILDETYCPVCKSNMGSSIKTIAYYNCSWKIIGKIKGESKSFKVENRTKEYEVSQYLPTDKVSKVEFAYLMLEAEPL